MQTGILGRENRLHAGKAKIIPASEHHNSVSKPRKQDKHAAITFNEISKTPHRLIIWVGVEGRMCSGRQLFRLRAPEPRPRSLFLSIQKYPIGYPKLHFQHTSELRWYVKYDEGRGQDQARSPQSGSRHRCVLSHTFIHSAADGNTQVGRQGKRTWALSAFIHTSSVLVHALLHFELRLPSNQCPACLRSQKYRLARALK